MAIVLNKRILQKAQQRSKPTEKWHRWMQFDATVASFPNRIQLKNQIDVILIQGYKLNREHLAHIFRRYTWHNAIETEIFKNKIHELWAQIFAKRKKTYVAAGASLIPMQNPITAKQMQIIENDCANPSNSHVNASGMVSINRVVRRPNLSQTMPLSKLPIGWTINEQRAKKNCRNLKRVSKKKYPKKKKKDWLLQSQDDWAAVICIVSSGFDFELIPTNALITIAENAVNSPKFKMNKFFAIAPKIFSVCCGSIYWWFYWQINGKKYSRIR